MSLQCLINNLETTPEWTKEWSKDINAVEPDGYDFIQTTDGIRLYTVGHAYAGWLAKFVSPLLFPFTKILFNYSLNIDDATPQQAQVIETDSKITDAAGWTYDLSAQLNIQKGWMFQVDDAAGDWVDTVIKIPALKPNTVTPFSIAYVLDYVNHVSSVTSVSVGQTPFQVPVNLQKIPAKRIGWQPSTVVTQLQGCNNGLPYGAHSWKISQCGYTMTT